MDNKKGKELIFNSKSYYFYREIIVSISELRDFLSNAESIGVNDIKIKTIIFNLRDKEVDGIKLIPFKRDKKESWFKRLFQGIFFNCKK